MSNTEKISGLIVTEALLQGERQLLRDRNAPQQDMKGGPPSPPAAPPISHSDKTMAPVLLTLLDEQLSGNIADEASRMGARQGEIPPSPNRVAARYAEDDRVFRADTPASGTALPQGQAYPHIAQAVLSTDSQRFQIGKNKNLPASASGRHGSDRDRKGAADPASGTSVIKIAGVVLGIATALIALAAKYYG